MAIGNPSPIAPHAEMHRSGRYHGDVPGSAVRPFVPVCPAWSDGAGPWSAWCGAGSSVQRTLARGCGACSKSHGEGGAVGRG
jgi:hypothetical protein